jgi:hypothetical protein
MAERYEGLGHTVAEFQRLLGIDGARALADAFGGHRIHVPEKPGDNHPITVALGRALADRFAGAYAGDRVHVPMMPRTVDEIRRLRAEGLSNRQIAETLTITERWVYMVLSRRPVETERAPDLFERP